MTDNPFAKNIALNASYCTLFGVVAGIGVKRTIELASSGETGPAILAAAITLSMTALSTLRLKSIYDRIALFEDDFRLSNETTLTLARLKEETEAEHNPKDPPNDNDVQP